MYLVTRYRIHNCVDSYANVALFNVGDSLMLNGAQGKPNHQRERMDQKKKGMRDMERSTHHFKIIFNLTITTPNCL
jgi:hypothetical protein